MPSECIVHGSGLGILLQWQRNLILAFGWLDQLRDPRNRRRIGRLEIEFLDQECDAVTASLGIVARAEPRKTSEPSVR